MAVLAPGCALDEGSEGNERAVHDIDPTKAARLATALLRKETQRPPLRFFVRG